VAKPAVKMPPLKGSHVKDDDNTCFVCHTNADLWDPKDKTQYKFYIALDGLKKDIHYQKLVNCADCHGGDATILEPKAHQTDDFRAKLPEIQKFCAHCHEKAVALLNASPHKVAIDLPGTALKNVGAARKCTSCLDCHAGKDAQGKTSPHTIVANLSVIEKSCASCHEKAVALLGAGAHRSVHCVDCHASADGAPGGAPGTPGRGQGKISPHAIAAGMNEKLKDQAGLCGRCHSSDGVKAKRAAVDVITGLNASVHAKAFARNSLNCASCHGQLGHGLLPVKDPQSPVSFKGQVEHCGGCHLKKEEDPELREEDREKVESFLRSIHGQARDEDKKTKDINWPGCADCHGAHNVFRPNDKRSTINATQVATTCGKCHTEQLKELSSSIHGRGGLGGQASRPAPGGTKSRKPTCTDCHQRHDPPPPESAGFRQTLRYRCGNCHASMSSTYALSMHGKLDDLGYAPAAECADCHGSHGILPLDDPKSTLAPENRVHTCAKCHAKAGANFANFSPHVDPYDARKNPVVHSVQITLLTLLYSTFIFFGIHSLLWFVRGLVEVLKHGRPHGLRPGQTAYVRFVSFHRFGHTVMMTSFLGLALTGLPLKYHEAPWAKTLARAMGGFPWTSGWHRFFGVVLLASMAVYLARMVYLLVKGRKQGQTTVGMIFGSDSPLPTLRDLKDFLKMLRWFFGLGPRPGFDRWSYWEKIDFWGAIADTVIIGSTGLVLWFHDFFCGPLPGTALNIAQVVHSTQALLATGFVFAIHFFNTHLRPDRFPADMSVLTGLVSEEEFKEDRPEYFQRLEQEGKLAALRTTSPGLFVLWSIRIFGFLALAVGLALLVGMIVASLS
jgi:cytochrome b subunit of formate dehydrogenase